MRIDQNRRGESQWALTLSPIILNAGVDPSDALVIRHAYVREHEDSGISGIHAESTDEEILEYTRSQPADTRRFPASPPRFWIVFIREGGDQVRLWLRSKTAARSPMTVRAECST